jgi:signal transduction histidine kinase
MAIASPSAAWSGERRAPLIGGLVITVIVVLAVLRELFAPEARLIGGVDLVVAGARPHPARPVGLLVEMVFELVALQVLARVLDRRGWRLLWHVLATAGLAIAIGSLYTLAMRAALHPASPLARSLVVGPLGGMQIYALWILAFRHPQVVDDARLRAFEADRLRRAAELSRLRGYLQPHFLRNTLNAIAAFVTEDPDAARDLLAALGDLLSDSLDDATTHTLAEETAWLRRYGEIFEARHRGALRLSWDLDPTATAVHLPRLLLQPLVENAIQHGALARADGGEVRIATRRSGSGAVITVEDNGPGFEAGRPERLGLHLVRSRLAIECPDSVLRIDASASGTRAIVELR